MEFQDYYRILGVDRDAPQDEIGKAYKRLARKYHPDLNKASDAESQFKHVNEAYEVLKDPAKRRRYDALGANWKHGAPFEPPPGFGGSGGPEIRFTNFGGGGLGGFSDFFSAFFGGGGGAGARGARRRSSIEDLFGGAANGAPRAGTDVQSTITIGLDDVYHARKLSLELSGQQGKRRYAVKIPGGTRDGEKIRLAGQGMSGRGGPKGDLYLMVKIAPHPTFEVAGDDLIVRVPVTAWDAALGARIPVPTMDGTAQMTLPAGLSSGQRMRLKQKGLLRRGGGRGDLLVELQIAVPKTLTPEQRELFERLRDATE